jgi:hypothetical protein
MIGKMIQSILCLGLCPLLAAQQAAQPVSPSDAPAPEPAPAKQYVTLPRDTNIELLAPGPAKLAEERAGVIVRFVVDKDVVLDGVPFIHASEPVVGVVDQVTRGSHFKHRAAKMDIRVSETISGRPTELYLRCFDSSDSSVSGYSQRRPDAEFDAIKWGIIAGLVLAVLAAFNGDR